MVQNHYDNDLLYPKLLTKLLELSDANVSTICRVTPSQG